MANLTQTTMSSAIMVQYEKRLLTRALPRLIHGRWSEKARMGKFGTMQLRKYAGLSAITTPLNEGTTPGEQSAPTISTVTFTPLWYGAYLAYTDELDLTNFDPVISISTAILGEQCGLSMDTLFRTELITDATADFSGGQSAANTLDYPAHEITYADILFQVAELEAQNALPVEGDRFACVIHPHSFASLMQDPTFVNMFVQESGDGNPMRTGYVGNILRCNLYVSSNAYENADAGVNSTEDIYSALFIAKESYGSVSFAGLDPSLPDSGKEYSNMTGQQVKPVSMIIKELGSAGADDPLNQRGTVAWKAVLDVEVLNSSWIRNLQHVNVFSDE